MKTAIHPKTHPVIFLDTASGAEFMCTSTLRSEESKRIDGVEYQVIKVETSSASHPFYTGTQQHATKGNQVSRYLEKVAKAKANAEAKSAKPSKKKA